ncbi:MAG: hypothetical protein II886_11100 [Prevotella sp.]|nr:hypothetical protein [Prevotella sp.]
MQRLLKPNEVAQIDERLHDNALLQTCRKVWRRRGIEVTSVVACAEDIFCEAAWLTDELIEAGKETEASNLTLGLWNDVSNDVAKWENKIPLTDRYLIVSTVFQIVATAFSLHWDSHYCDDLRDALIETENKYRDEHPPKDLYALQEQQRHQDALLEVIIPCSVILKRWINDYIDNPDLWLTEEIDMALNPPINIKAGKKESRKADKKVFDADTFRETFNYQPDGMSNKEREIRLKMAFNKMRGILIDRETHYDTFKSLFTGKPLDVKIVWIGTNAQLRKLFNLLITKNKLISKPTGGLNQILTARFKKVDGSSFTTNEIKDAGNDGDMSVVNDVVEYLTPIPVQMEDLEQQLSRIVLEEQERADLRGDKNGKPQKHLPKGTNSSPTPNQHTRKSKK